jgi:hypothetical protein
MVFQPVTPRRLAIWADLIEQALSEDVSSMDYPKRRLTGHRHTLAEIVHDATTRAHGTLTGLGGTPQRMPLPAPH